jgi:hypothetical protein
MGDCYRFEERLYNDGIFKGESIDATYIIHLEGNGRLLKVNSELENLHPTNRLWILHNKGFRVCHKDGIDSPALDLIACYHEIFRHANVQKYSNILILEDDFFFDGILIKDAEITESITGFLLEKRDEDFAYSLGCLPILQTPLGEHRRSISLGTHAVIYSRKCRDRVLLVPPQIIGDWDIWQNFNTKKYMFHRPVCYQLFPKTENQKGWLSGYLPEFIQSFFYIFIILPFFNSLALDKSIEPGYPLFYSLSSWVSGFIVLLLLYITFMTIYMKM